MKDSDEEFVAEEEAENPSAALKRLREKLATAVKEKQEYLEGWQRSRADFANFKKEESAREQEKEDRLKLTIVEELLPLLDSFDLAQAADEKLSTSLSPMHKQLLSTLKNFGVEPIGSVDGKELIGSSFDPAEHEAIQEIESAPDLEHCIVKVFRSGYKIGDRIIRPAQVAIGVQK